MGKRIFIVTVVLILFGFYCDYFWTRGGLVFGPFELVRDLECFSSGHWCPKWKPYKVYTGPMA